MEKKKKIILIILAVIVVILIILISCLVYKKNGKKSSTENTINNNLYEEIKIEELSIKIKEVKYSEDFSNIKLEVINNSNSDKNLTDIKLIFKDKDNNVLAELLSSTDEILKVGESTIVSISIDKDITSSYSVSYELVGGIENEEEKD